MKESHEFGVFLIEFEWKRTGLRGIRGGMPYGTGKNQNRPYAAHLCGQALGRVPESLYDLQKIKNLSCGGRPVYQELIDPLKDALPERLEIVRGDFSLRCNRLRIPGESV